MNGTLTMGRSSPVNVPTLLKEKIDIFSSIQFSSITFESTSSSYDVSYGSESLPAICEYGNIGSSFIFLDIL